jgi:uncharacterized protein YyaL (SSP411 family)
MTGRGGWPMTVFLDPEGVPFYGGTYFPPDDGRGMPSFRTVMEAVVDAYERRRDELRARAPQTRARLGAIAMVEPASEAPGASLLGEAVATLLAAADMDNGGFGGAPKFPPACALELLLARGAADHREVKHVLPDIGAKRVSPRELDVVERTLDAMLAGGIYDQLGGGFARYSVDARWLVPHFEKMLYDNALLARAYLHGWQALGHERWRRACEETLDWALREMRGPEGGFYSALDADSEGEEGRFYVWTPAEIRELLGERAGEVIDFYGVTEAGNFEGRNVLHLGRGAAAARPPGLDEARRALLEARERRPRPGLDDKRLTSWNALMLAALAEAGAVLGREDYLDAARRCAKFLLGSMRDPEGRLLRSYKDGQARLNAYLEDHAFLLEALLTLYEASLEPSWFEQAEAIAGTMIARFGDPERGGFFSTSDDHEALIARRKEIGDHPIPSGNSAAALGLLRLAALSGDRAYEAQASGVLRLFARAAARQPESFAHLLRALEHQLSPTKEVALVAPAHRPRPAAIPGDGSAEPLSELLAVVRSTFRPHLVLAAGPEGATTPALLKGRTSVQDLPTAYVCENFTCQAPTTDAGALAKSL